MIHVVLEWTFIMMQHSFVLQLLPVKRLLDLSDMSGFLSFFQDLKNKVVFNTFNLFSEVFFSKSSIITCVFFSVLWGSADSTDLSCFAEISSRGRRWGDEFYSAAVCQSHWWGEKEYKRHRGVWNVCFETWMFCADPSQIPHLLSPSVPLFSWAPVMQSCQLSLLMPWCFPSLSLRSETLKVENSTSPHSVQQI